jgi:hypothetical protein
VGLPHPLRSAFRLSQPPSGFLLPNAFRPYFMPETLLGFTLQGFSLSKSWVPLGTSSSLAVGQPLRNLRTTSAFSSVPPPSARASASFPRPPTELDSTPQPVPQGSSPRWFEVSLDPLSAQLNLPSEEREPGSTLRYRAPLRTCRA